MEHYGALFPYDLFREQWQRCRETILEFEGIGIKPGLFEFELLDYLELHKTRAAVATSTSTAKGHRPSYADVG
jgi:hypothetical protein